ncbi:MAG: G1 family glutamic endopeptidase, partial [Acidimicrobiales bacterium]
MTKPSRHVRLGAPAAASAASVTRGPDPARWVSTSPYQSETASAAPSQTLNWAGEISSGVAISSVTGSWVVPTVLPSATPRDSAAWIGIGGSTAAADGLIQTGTDQSTDNGGTSYRAWYEVLPAPAVTAVDPSTGQPLPVDPGDRMHGEIDEVRAGLWRIEIQDLTQGWTSSGTFAYQGTTTSAEWIVEAPTVRAQIETLADFQSVRFTDMQAGAASPGAGGPLPVEMVTEGGTVIAYPGSVTSATTQSVTVHYAATPATTAPEAGYDLADAKGNVFVFDPPGQGGGYFGSLTGSHIVPNEPIVAMVSTIDHQGYYLVTADGGVFSFGDAPFLGSLPGIHVVPNEPIVGMAIAETGRGYYLVGADGGVFSFGDAPFFGSLLGEGVRRDDVVGIAAMPSGAGYWLMAAGGEVYPFGSAQHLGTVQVGTSRVTAAVATRTGGGYWTVTASGSVSAFGDARSFGTLPRAG